MMKSDLLDLKVMRHAETERAVLVSDDGDSKKAVWLPKQNVEIENGPHGTVTITLPEWLALEKGLI